MFGDASRVAFAGSVVNPRHYARSILHVLFAAGLLIVDLTGETGFIIA
jgi:hypothetical protein